MLQCQIWDHLDAGLSRQRTWCCIDFCDSRKSTEYTSQQLFNNFKHIGGWKGKTSERLYACTITYFTYDVWVQSWYVNTEEFPPREGGRIHTERKNSLKVGRNQLKSRPSGNKEVYLSLFEPKPVTTSVWPRTGLLGCALYLVLEFSWSWPKSGQV